MTRFNPFIMKTNNILIHVGFALNHTAKICYATYRCTYPRTATWEGSPNSLALSFAYKIKMVSVCVFNPLNPMENTQLLAALSTKYKLWIVEEFVYAFIFSLEVRRSI